MRLRDKVALVTGGGSGFGAAICRRFAAEGARLIVADVNQDAGADLARELGDAAAFCRADVARAADTEAMVAAAVERFGRLDILVNNAGLPMAPQSFVDTSEEQWDHLFAV